MDSALRLRDVAFTSIRQNYDWLDNDSILRILNVRRRDCVPSVVLRRRLCLTRAGLVMLKNFPTVTWSRTSLCSHSLELGADELEASWRRGQPRSRHTMNPYPDRESSVTHDGERIWWKPLVSSHRTVVSRGQLDWWCRLNTTRVNAATSTNKSK